MAFNIKEHIVKLNNGEVPDGYKRTEFGVFPCDWITDNRLGDLFGFYGGLSKSREELGDEGHPYLHYGDLHRNPTTVASQNKYLDLPKYACDISGRETFLMQDGDVAFLDASEDLEGTSRAVLIDNPNNKPFIAGLHIINGRSKNDSLHKWYKQYITTPQYIKKQFQRLAVGFKVYGINKDTLPKIQVAFPKSNEEQSKIAEILMKWDEAIELYENIISLLSKRRQCIHNKIYGLCDAWTAYTLDQVLREKFEYSISNNQFEVLSSTKLGLFAQKDYFDKQVASENNIGYKIIKRGDIVLSPQNLWLGNINYNKDFGIGIVSPSYKVFEIIPPNNKSLVSTILKFPTMLHEYVLASEQGASVVRRNLNMELFNKIKIKLPNSDIQEAFGKVIEELDYQVGLYELQYQKLKLQRKALQQYLLTGIVRV